MHCAACAVRNERTLVKIPGVLKPMSISARAVHASSLTKARSRKQRSRCVTDNGYDISASEASAIPAACEQEVKTARERALLGYRARRSGRAPGDGGYFAAFGASRRNASVWIQAILSSVVILGLGASFIAA